MNFIKIVTILNWIVIGVLALLVAAETLFPAKGGDAAGRGMGQAIYYLSIIAVVVLGILNLLPFNWTKYIAFGLVAVPIALVLITPVWRKMKREAAARREYAKPIFEDKEREQIARAILEGEPERLKKLLQTPVARLNEQGELLSFAVNEAASGTYKPEEKMECVRILFESGASLDSANTLENPIHMHTAFVGNAPLLRYLLERGANPNAIQYNFKKHIIFEAIDSYMEPEASVRALLDFGADPNVTALLDDEKGKVTPLYRAAQMGRWGVCVALLEKGADPDTKADDGTSFQTYFDEVANREYSGDGYSTKEDLERLKTYMEKQ